jgi:CheY-like chemotaxis protein
MSDGSNMREQPRGHLEAQEQSLAQPISLPVLVIDDDPKLVERLSTTLEGAGYPVVCGSSKTNFERLLAPSGVASAGMAGVVLGSRKLVRTWSISDEKFARVSKRIVLLQKPFNRKRLLVAVRETIGQPPSTQRLLLVDDEESIRDIMALMLSCAGYRCRGVASSIDALKLLEAGEKFDLITSDICNEWMWGSDFVEQVKQRYPEIQTLLITGCWDIPDALHKGPDLGPEQRSARGTRRRTDGRSAAACRRGANSHRLLRCKSGRCQET